ncbi:MAG: hypothetical protein K5892_04055 [Acholeplasmatales bacterium]|nr:hypothetical protein [Acholeplasmatales bacterium]
MKKYFLAFLLLPSLFLVSCGEDEKEDNGITLPSKISTETSIDYSNDREGRSEYNITSYDPVESISWQSVSTQTSTTTTEEDENGNLTLPTKAE